MESKKKVLNIIEIVVGIIFVVGFIVCIIMQCVNPTAAFSVWLKENIWDISKTVEGFKNQLPEIINCLIYIVMFDLTYY